MGIQDQKDHVYVQGRHDDTQIIAYTYTCQNQVESMTRGYETSASRVTGYTYFPSGKLSTKTLPDGVTLRYTYSPLYQLKRMDSSDGCIHHQFLHDKLGYLLSARDENLDIEIKRDVDPDGNVLREVFPSDPDCYQTSLETYLSALDTTVATKDKGFPLPRSYRQ